METSDVTLLLPGGQPIAAHKAILSSRCEKFKTMFMSTPKDLSDRVEIKCDDPVAFIAMIEHFREVVAAGDLGTLDAIKMTDIMAYLHSKAQLSHLKHKICISKFFEHKDEVCFRSDPFAFHGCLWQLSFDPSEQEVSVNLFLHNYAYLGSQLHFSLEFVNFIGENIKIVATHDFEKVGSVYGFVITLPKRQLRLKEDTLEVVVEITPPKKKEDSK